jgi:hypothetical protein
VMPAKEQRTTMDELASYQDDGADDRWEKE